ncbi:hypothetical protein TNCV_3560481 [Trichonephila clavipes]|uniref:Uncharacterized protein n=1 Tax=Trichonephila clavipes TaxID=2585209 RepID=A0A8X6WCX4_TRICX|nr:hypothetical protein TNCV_3560481 [Trichonephila clavipes]
MIEMTVICVARKKMKIVLKIDAKDRWKLQEKSAGVIEREISAFLHKFLEESRGYRTRQCGQNGHQIGRQLDHPK